MTIVRVGKRTDEGSATQVGSVRNVMGSKSTKTLGRSGENWLGGLYFDEAEEGNEVVVFEDDR